MPAENQRDHTETVPVYLAVAYRFGWLNGESYRVWGGTDREEAIVRARAEQADRAGKYGVTVWQIRGDDETEVVHYASSRGETHAEWNARIWARNEIGFKVGAMVDSNVIDPEDIRECVVQSHAIGKMVAGLKSDVSTPPNLPIAIDDSPSSLDNTRGS